MTDRDDETPVVKITDKRRFANVAEGAAGTAAPSGRPSEPPSVASSEAPDGSPGDADDLLAATRAEAQEYLGHLQRLQAEFDNYRKRVLREQTAAVELASEPVMRRLLEVLDDFELALMSAESLSPESQADHERFLKGIELVYAKLADALKAEGLERIDAEGKPFDPALHEALMQTGEGTGDPVVAEVYRPGYTLRGRVVRPAGVRVERA